MDSHYDVLGIDRTATPEEIKRAFRELALKYHPDQHPTPIANALFVRIKEAYEVLSDPKKRAEYDRAMGFDGKQSEARAESTYCYYCGKRAATSAYRGRRACASCIDAREAQKEAPRDAEGSTTPHSSKGPTRGQVSPPTNLRVGLYVAAIVIGVAIGIATANPLIAYVAISLGVVLVAAFVSRLRTVLLLALCFFVVLPGGICGAVWISERLEHEERATLLREADDLVREAEKGISPPAQSSATGSIVVTTVPAADCTVLVGGEISRSLASGGTLGISGVTVGAYQFRLTCVGFETFATVINVERAQVTVIEARLKTAEKGSEKDEGVPVSMLLESGQTLPAAAGRCALEKNEWVRLRLDRPLYKVIWRRCVEAVEGAPHRPVDLLVVRSPLETGPATLAFANHVDPLGVWLNGVEVIDLRGDGAQQLLVEEDYGGSAVNRKWCVIGRLGPTIGCWAAPNLKDRTRELVGPADELLQDWRLDAVEGKALRLSLPIYGQSDPNCCPSRGQLVAELHAHPTRPALVLEKMERLRCGEGAPERTCHQQP